jgi:hypothetical protein
MWARIDNGIVRELTDQDPAGRFHPSIEWRPADELVEVGDGFDGTDYTAPPALTRDEAKDIRTVNVARIRVTTTAGREFDGDETSQNRMARAILGLSAAPPGTTITWTLADNTPATVGVAELTEALMLAGATQAAMWGLPS